MDFLLNKSMITCPLLIGKNLSDAVIILSDNDLNIRIIDIHYNTITKEPTILHQQPLAGQLIKKKQPVFCVIDCPPKKQAIDNYIGSNRAIIKKNQKTTQCSFHYLQHSLPLHTCIAQTTELFDKYNNRPLHYFISKGFSSHFIMPRLIDQPILTLESIIKNTFPDALILHTGNTYEKCSCVHCIVIEQKPLPGTIIDLHKIPRVQLLVKPRS